MNNSSNFYALLNRMKYIERWSLMRNSVPDNLIEHSYQVAYITQALCLIKNKLYGGNVNVEKAVSIAMFHDASEVITGDMPTPIKYNNPKIEHAYKEMEALAESKLLEMLPEFLRDYYAELISPDTSTEEYKLVKYADKLAAYLTCEEETNAGNKEYSVARDTTFATLCVLGAPEVKYFLDNFTGGFFKPLDVLK